MEQSSPLALPLATPAYPEVTLYLTMLGHPRPWEFNGWKPESLSWKNGCYIHAGLSGPHAAFEGPDATEFLSWLCINGFSSFPHQSAKHAIMLDDDGLVAAHGLLQRDDEQSYRFFAGGIWPMYQLSKSDFDVTVKPLELFVFQVSGPTALQTLERATGESLRDIDFLRYRKTQVAGLECEICRIGMSGTLSYELRGPYEQGPQVYEAVVEAGDEFGIERLGWRAYPVNHAEGGFAQAAWTFAPSAIYDPGFRDFMAEFTGSDVKNRKLAMSGSVDPANRRARYRSPVEVDWQRAARLDHDFIGREALEREMANPKSTLVTLRWNPDDVLDVYASLLRPGEEYKTFELPTTPQFTKALAHADHVLKDGQRVGISSATAYSYHYREFISHCTIDREHAEIGTEVVVQWGDYGHAIKEIRATVARFPYLEAERNDRYDIDSIPSGVSPGA